MFFACYNLKAERKKYTIIELKYDKLMKNDEENFLRDDKRFVI